MALKKRGKYWYGDSQADIRDELMRFGKLNAYVPTQFADARCRCGGTTFRLRMDENEGAAIRVCAACGMSTRLGIATNTWMVRTYKIAVASAARTRSKSPLAFRCTKVARMSAGCMWVADAPRAD